MKQPTPTAAYRAVHEHFGIDRNTIASRSRGHVSEARSFLAHILHDYCGMTYQEIDQMVYDGGGPIVHSSWIKANERIGTYENWESRVRSILRAARKIDKEAR